MAETLLSPSILEAVPDAVIVVNRQGVIIQANSKTETLFAETRDELIGQQIEMLVPEGSGPSTTAIASSFTPSRRSGAWDRASTSTEGAATDLNFPFEISLSPVATSDGTMVLSVIRDISDRKHIEEELRRVNEELDRRKTPELRDSQNRLALIVDSSQDAIIGKNLERQRHALE